MKDVTHKNKQTKSFHISSWLLSASLMLQNRAYWQGAVWLLFVLLCVDPITSCIPAVSPCIQLTDQRRQTVSAYTPVHSKESRQQQCLLSDTLHVVWLEGIECKPTWNPLTLSLVLQKNKSPGSINAMKLLCNKETLWTWLWKKCSALKVFCSQNNIPNHGDILNEEWIQLINQLILCLILNFPSHALQMKTFISQMIIYFGMTGNAFLSFPCLEITTIIFLFTTHTVSEPSNWNQAFNLISIHLLRQHY